ncbi:unnamed protein product, partial [Symbiodinium sp. CCMP2456]
MTLLSLPMSLKTGSLRVNVDQFGSDIGDSADRAMRLRCCTEQEAWRICASPLIAISAALAELCEPLQQLPEDKAFDLSWPELARPQVWWWLLVDEIVAHLQHAAEASQTAPLARDGSFFVMALGGPERHASPLQYCGALMPMQVLIYVLRRLVDNPAAYPRLQILEVFKDTDRRAADENRDDHIGVRISVSFEAGEICPLQWEVGRRLRQSFERGVVALHHPVLHPANFTHPPQYKG